jgi:hypothetical protein
MPITTKVEKYQRANQKWTIQKKLAAWGIQEEEKQNKSTKQ